ncbi:MAG TPA: TonB-dependent receptor [Thermodesulfovibrionales bacterium]|nr:TonB-dependent receptor [Thermodesulfovibrionales bacterium]
MKPVKASLLIVVIFSTIFTLFLLPSPAVAETCVQWVARVVSVQGSVQVRRVGTTQWEPTHFGDTFCPGDMVRVLERSRSEIMLANESILRLDQKTTVTFSMPEKEKTFLIDLIDGAVHFFSRFRRSLKVTTPFVNATVEGTEFLVKVERDKTFISLFEGRVLAENKAGSIMLDRGQSAVAMADQAPVIRVVARPRDAVQWTLYYPPVFSYRPGDLQTALKTDWRARVSLLLSVGRIDEAKAEIDEALKTTPGNSDALALQSVIAVVQNEKERALDLGRRSVEADPKSACARIALSYAQQANFDLQGALKTLKEAVALEPENALAWARLSELWLSFGNLDEALKAAKQAAGLNPALARTQTVLGFAYLTQIEITTAVDAFHKAIELDEADPLPRLGLGLARIRKGDLSDGRGDIEIAAGLDPDNSLIRSYLGKAYYEEKRDKVSSDQFTMAKELDPLDPTSYFYDAIRKQSINRPVEALYDLQKAIELNDDRAVYRSRLLLDEDLAARSANLSGIYSDLGFQQLAVEEAANSVNADPASFSAHRFLSDSYSALPRHEIARVNELLQSQLLQPINITPVRPELAESNLFILEGTGPAQPSFNEFNPLFNRNRIALQLDGAVGSNSTFGDEVIVSGVHDKLSFSLGQFHYETDGFRENNDLKTNIYNVFAQYSLSENTSIQAEYRNTNTTKGDLELRFDPENFTPTLRQKEDIDSFRLGLRHSFAPGSELLTSLIYQHATTDTVVFPDIFQINGKANNYVGEVRYLYKISPFHITAGIGHRQLDQTLTSIFSGVPSPEDLKNRFTNIYLYTQIDVQKNLSLTLGGSGDFLEGAYEGEGRNQFNPKLGLTWQPLPSTTVRAAVFRTLQRPFISIADIDPSLEPTEIAGFNQFFDDLTGDEAWRYGIGVDQKISANLSAGAEISARDLDHKIIDVTGPTPVAISRDWQEKLGRAYLYWTPTLRVAVSAEYFYEWFSREADALFVGVEQFTKLRTHRVPITVGYFDPSGFSATVKATYVNQQGDFVPTGPGNYALVPGKDDFWVFDAAIRYRLPKRFGMISLEAKNLFDEKFKFQDTDPGNPRIFPDRLILLKLTLAF